MKSPRPKIHLIDVDEPLFAFRDLVMRCETVIHNAEVKYMVEAELSIYVMPPPGMCTKCWDNPPIGDEARRYEYGLVEAQEKLNRESEEN